MKHLRQTPTNSADDSKGHSLGLEGDQFLYVIGALIAGVVLLLISMNSGASPGMSLLLASLPMPVAVLFLFIFKIGKPPRYAGDLMQKLFGNRSLKRDEDSTNPYSQAQENLEIEDED